MQPPLTPREIGELLGAHGPSLELYAAQWTQQAEDCVQEAFIALASLARRPDQPIAWLYRVVRNRAYNACRSNQRRANHERLASVLVETSTRDPLDLEEEKADLTKALEELSGHEREIIVLRIWSQMKWREIAEVTQTPQSSAQRIYVGALKKLKGILEPCPNHSNCQTN